MQRLGDFYTADARFKDPFNEVRGVPAITRIFEHMFQEPARAPLRRDPAQLVDGPQAFLVWEFRFRFQRGDTSTIEQVIRGGSHLTLVTTTAASATTATTGTRPKSCMKSCRCWAR